MTWHMDNHRDLLWHIFEGWARFEAWLGRRFHIAD